MTLQRALSLPLALVVALLAAAAAAWASEPAAPAMPGAERDVRFLAERMEALHPNLFHAVSREEFHAAAADLAQRAPTLDANELLVALMRFTALPGERDGHTGIFPLDAEHGRPLHVFPIWIYDFPEGFFVVAETGRGGLVGSRLLEIEGIPVERLVAGVRPLVPRDNEWSLRARVPTYLLTAEVLDGLGLVEGVRPLRFTFARRDGSVREVTLSPVTVDDYLRSFPSLFHPMIPVGLPRRPRPAYLARRDAAWWSKTLSRGRVAYLAYNVTTFDTDPLARRLLRLAARARVRRVVIDLRHNPGGNNATYWDLLQALRDRRINRSGRLVVLIGRTTFSAAANFATEVDRRTNAVFVGEPTGGSPNLYGDPEAVRLPVSGWNTNVATIYWQKSSRGDRRVAIVPDVRVELTAAAFFAGRDPVLAAALRVSR